MSVKIVLLPGDGIGTEIMASAVKVLHHVAGKFDIEIELSNGQVFEAYEMSGADYFVSPDEIILPLDSQEEIRQKVNTIKENLSALLETIPSSKVIAVIQGHQKKIIDELLDFYRENGVQYFAMGGVIPLYHHDRKLLEKSAQVCQKSNSKGMVTRLWSASYMVVSVLSS